MTKSKIIQILNLDGSMYGLDELRNVYILITTIVILTR